MFQCISNCCRYLFLPCYDSQEKDFEEDLSRKNKYGATLSPLRAFPRDLPENSRTTEANERQWSEFSIDDGFVDINLLESEENE